MKEIDGGTFVGGGDKNSSIVQIAQGTSGFLQVPLLKDEEMFESEMSKGSNGSFNIAEVDEAQEDN